MIQEFFADYIAVLIAAILGFTIVGVALAANRILAPRQATRVKALTYECGMLPIGRSRSQVHFRYYLFAILFLIFDIEAVFLFPWAVSFLGIGVQQPVPSLGRLAADGVQAVNTFVATGG